MLKVYCARFDGDDEEGDDYRGFNDEGDVQYEGGVQLHEGCVQYEGGVQLHEGHDDDVMILAPRG